MTPTAEQVEAYLRLGGRCEIQRTQLQQPSGNIVYRIQVVLPDLGDPPGLHSVGIDTWDGFMPTRQVLKEFASALGNPDLAPLLWEGLPFAIASHTSPKPHFWNRAW